jgi:protein involved in polysaccharide export with SLBB domain
MMNRRHLFQLLAGVPFLGGFFKSEKKTDLPYSLTPGHTRVRIHITGYEENREIIPEWNEAHDRIVALHPVSHTDCFLDLELPDGTTTRVKVDEAAFDRLAPFLFPIEWVPTWDGISQDKIVRIGA